MRRPTIIALCLLAIAGAAHAGDVPPEKTAVILTRALSYDQLLSSRAGGAIVIAVLYKNGDPGAQALADAMYAAFKRLDHVRVQGLPISTVKLPFDGAARLRAQIVAQGIDLLFVCEGLSKELAQIIQVTRVTHVLSASAVLEDVRDGASIGVFLEGAQSSITINLAACRDEGAAFSAELLRLAKILR